MHFYLRSCLVVLFFIASGSAPCQENRAGAFELSFFPIAEGGIGQATDILLDEHGYVWLLDQRSAFCLLSSGAERVWTHSGSDTLIGWESLSPNGFNVRSSSGTLNISLDEWQQKPSTAILSEPGFVPLQLDDGRTIQLTDTGSLLIKGNAGQFIQSLATTRHQNLLHFVPGAAPRMLLDPKKGVWVLGENGLLLARFHKTVFRSVETKSGIGKVAQVVENVDKDRVYIYSHRRGLVIQKLSSGELIKHITTGPNGMRFRGTKWKVINDEHYFNGHHGAWRFDTDSEDVELVVDVREHVPDDGRDTRINDLAADTKNGLLYLGLVDNIMIVHNTKTRTTVSREILDRSKFSGINLIVESACFSDGRALVMAEHGQFIVDGLDGPIIRANEVWPSFRFGPSFRASGVQLIGDSLVVVPSFANGLFIYHIDKDSLYRPIGPNIDRLMITDIFWDGLGHIYGATKTGLLMYQLSDNTLRVIRGEHGLPVEDLYYRYMRGGKPGEMFFGLTDRYVKFYTEELLRENAQGLYVEALNVNGLSQGGPYIPMGSTINSSYLENSISFQLGHPGGTLPPLTSMFLKLDEQKVASFHQDGDMVHFPALAPGKHTIRIGFQAYGPFEDLLIVQITPPVWRTWWFVSLLSLLAVAVIIVVFRIRIQSATQRATLQAEYDTRIMQLELSSLRSQMHPHFIFNSLNSIKSFIAQNEPRTATRYLNKFSQLIRSILNNSRHARVELRSELKALELYLELEQMRFEQSFDLSVEVDENIDLDEVTIPPMIIQPYAENAIWHGLMHKNGDRKLEIKINKKGDMLECVIRDNGIGREAAQAMKSKTATKHRSLGMKITAEIIQRTHSDGTEGVEITDLRDKTGNPAGTEVRIQIPIERA